ncbi:hypothetical protein EV363DRAFT_1436930 [Boletus edulis]|nr:hypothetical protein EV363DRAFT_1436930 [Boletus edulis]
MLFSQGFRISESLPSKIVPFSDLCKEQFSPQPPLRLWSHARLEDADAVDGLSDVVSERVVVIQSVTETIVPKLVADDMFSLEDYVPVDQEVLREQILKACAERPLVDDSEDPARSHDGWSLWPSGTGKTIAWPSPFFGIGLDGIKGVWIADDVRGESSKRYWIIFDGDIDPESLNSVLDDDKLLALPNGSIPRCINRLAQKTDNQASVILEGDEIQPKFEEGILGG